VRHSDGRRSWRLEFVEDVGRECGLVDRSRLRLVACGGIAKAAGPGRTAAESEGEERHGRGCSCHCCCHWDGMNVVIAALEASNGVVLARMWWWASLAKSKAGPSCMRRSSWTAIEIETGTESASENASGRGRGSVSQDLKLQRSSANVGEYERT
jgi:hypothetical protein